MRFRTVTAASLLGIVFSIGAAANRMPVLSQRRIDRDGHEQFEFDHLFRNCAKRSLWSEQEHRRSPWGR